MTWLVGGEVEEKEVEGGSKLKLAMVHHYEFITSYL
jgi:hypothetical protein